MTSQSQDMQIKNLAEMCEGHVARINELNEQVSLLTEQRDAVVVENAALISAFATKEIPTEATDAFSDTAVLRIDGDEFRSWMWVDNQDDVIRTVLDFFKPETPATNSILDSLRAEGVEMFASAVQGGSAISDRVIDLATDFACQLRESKGANHE